MALSGLGRQNLENKWERFVNEEGGSNLMRKLASSGDEDRGNVVGEIIKGLTTNTEVGYPNSSFRKFIEEKAAEAEDYKAEIKANLDNAWRKVSANPRRNFSDNARLAQFGVSEKLKEQAVEKLANMMNPFIEVGISKADRISFVREMLGLGVEAETDIADKTTRNR